MMKAELNPKSEENLLSNKDNYYFTRLTENQKKVYGIILLGLQKLEKEIKIPLLSMEEISMIFSRVLLDNPMIFYVLAFTVSSSVYSSQCSFIPNYKYDMQFIIKNTKIIHDYLHIFDKIKSKNDLDKEMFVHDYCLNNFTYDYAFNDYSYSVLGPILNKTAVCDGIAKFVKLAFDYLNLKSLVVNGKANNPLKNNTLEGHSWNIVLIDGKYFHLDVTWDMCMTRNIKRYDYFNLCHDDILKDHKITENIPICTTKEYDYYTKNALIANNPTEFKAFIISNLKKGKKNIVVKLNNVKNDIEIINRITEIIKEQYVSIMNKSTSFEIGGNLNQMVFEINFN